MTNKNFRDRARLAACIADEEAMFVSLHPKSKDAALLAGSSFIGGVPMPWMKRWLGAFPISLTEASGAKFLYLAGNELMFFCFGYTGLMTGYYVD